MPRKLRVQYLGAIYHVMNRGGRREAIFADDEDRHGFVAALGQACEKTGGQVHAYCLMSLKWISQRLKMGTWTYVSNCLGQKRNENEKCQ